MSQYENRSVARSFAILEYLRQNPNPRNLADISRGTGLHRATAFRMLSVLCDLGYVKKDQRLNSYCNSSKLHSFGCRSTVTSQVSKQLRPLVRQLAWYVGANAFLSSREGPHSVRWEIGYGDGNNSLDAFHRGMHVDAHASAEGKALLALQSNREIASLYEHTPMTQLTQRTATTVPELIKDLSRCRKRAYAVDDQEMSVGFSGVAAPIFVSSQTARFAIGVWGRREAISPDAVPDIAKVVLSMADRMAKELTATQPTERVDLVPADQSGGERAALLPRTVDA